MNFKSIFTVAFCVFVVSALISPLRVFADTLYHSSVSDTTWDTLDNWWTDSGFSSPAASLPANGDTVYLGGQIDTPPASPVALLQVYVASPVTGGGSFSVNIDGASGPVEFYDQSFNAGTIDGSAVFHNQSYNGGTVTGDAEFQGAHYESDPTGTVSGSISFTTADVEFVITGGSWLADASLWTMPLGATWIFNGASSNDGVTNGDTYFQEASVNNGAVASGISYFNDASYNNATLVGSAVFRDTSYNVGSIEGDGTFEGTEYTSDPVGSVIGQVTLTADNVQFIIDGGSWDIDTSSWVMPIGALWAFDNGAINYGVINSGALAEFNPGSRNNSTVAGNANFYGSGYNAGTVSGNAEFHGDQYDFDPTGTVEGSISFMSVFGLLFTINDGSWNADTSSWVLPNDAAWEFINSVNTGVINGDAYLLMGGYNTGTIEGDAQFADSSYEFDPVGVVNGGVTFLNAVAFNLTTDPWTANTSSWTFLEGASWVIGGTSGNEGHITGSTTFDGSTINTGTVEGPLAVFNSSSNNQGTITGAAEFYETSFNAGSVSAGALFSADSYNDVLGTVAGDATFVGHSRNDGTVSEVATFSDSAFNNGIVNGEAIFGGSSYNSNLVNGDVTYLQGAFTSELSTSGISGTVTFSNDVIFTMTDSAWGVDSSAWIFNGTNLWVFNGTALNTGSVHNATFNDSSMNQGSVAGTIAFYDTSKNTGGATPGGITPVHFYDSSVNEGGSISGSAVFHNNSSHQGSISGGDVTFNDLSYNAGSITGNATFNTAYYDTVVPQGGVFRISGNRSMDGTVSGSIFGSDHALINTYIFYDTSANNQTILGDAEFRDTSSNTGFVVGDACFDESATNTGDVSNNISVCEPEPVAPSVTTSAASAVLQTSATLNGEVTLGDDSTQHGFAYGTVSSLSTVVATTTLGALASPASFVSNAASLTCATTYYVRAYSTNTHGTGYGTIVNFTTPDCSAVSNPDPEPERRTSGGSSSRRTANQNTVNRGTEPVQVVNNTTITNPSPAKPVTIESFVNLMVAAGIITTDQLAQVKAILSTIVPAPQSFLRDLTVNDTGEDVVALQRVLITKGYLLDGLDTGTFGPLTLSALKAYQAANGIPSTGYFGPLSRAHVGL